MFDEHTFTPEPDPEAVNPAPVDEGVVEDDSVAPPEPQADTPVDEGEPEGSVFEVASAPEVVEDEVDEPAEDEVEGSESEVASVPEDASAFASPAEAAAAGVNPYGDGEYHAHRVQKQDTGTDNPVHDPEVAQAALAEQRPGVRGRPGIDD